jgi:hypothetical protein
MRFLPLSTTIRRKVSFTLKNARYLSSSSINNDTITTIGDIDIHSRKPSNPRLVPSKTMFDNIDPLPQEVMHHLRWIASKYNLGQDIMMLGHATSLRRELVMKFAQECGLEVEYMTISRDTTESGLYSIYLNKHIFISGLSFYKSIYLYINESDLKQRREIVGSTTSVFVDQPPVRAAIHGRILLLGIGVSISYVPNFN